LSTMAIDSGVEHLLYNQGVAVSKPASPTSIRSEILATLTITSGVGACRRSDEPLLATNVHLRRPTASPLAPLAIVVYETSWADMPVLRRIREDLSVRCQSVSVTPSRRTAARILFFGLRSACCGSQAEATDSTKASSASRTEWAPCRIPPWWYHRRYSRRYHI